MRVTVAEPRACGGMAQYAYGLASGLAHLGCEVTLVCPSDFELRAAPREFEILPAMRPWKRPARPSDGSIARTARRVAMGLRYGRETVHMARAIGALRSDVALLGGLEYGLEAAYVRYLRARGVRMAAIVHEIGRRDGASRLEVVDSLLRGHAYRACSAVLVHGQYNVALMSQVYPGLRDRVHSIPFGNHDSLAVHDRSVPESAMRARYGLDEDEPLVLFFGRLIPSKGLPTLIDAFSRISQQHPRARLLIAGKPARFFDLDGLRGAIRSGGLESSTTLDLRYLPLEEVGTLLRMARVLALPYLSATQSGVLMLAYGQGTPTVASKVGTFTEIIDDGESGLLVPPGDPEALAAAISSLLADPDRAARLGARALELSRTRHSWPNVARSVLKAVA